MYIIEKTTCGQPREIPDEHYKNVMLLPLSFEDVSAEDVPACSTYCRKEEWMKEAAYYYGIKNPAKGAIVLTAVLENETAESLGLTLQGFNGAFAVYSLYLPLNLAFLVEEIQKEEVEIQDMYWPCAIQKGGTNA